LVERWTVLPIKKACVTDSGSILYKELRATLDKTTRNWCFFIAIKKIYSPVAQLVERWTVFPIKKACVTDSGSILYKELRATLDKATRNWCFFIAIKKVSSPIAPFVE